MRHAYWFPTTCVTVIIAAWVIEQVQEQRKIETKILGRRWAEGKQRMSESQQVRKIVSRRLKEIERLAKHHALWSRDGF